MTPPPEEKITEKMTKLDTTTTSAAKTMTTAATPPKETHDLPPENNREPDLDNILDKKMMLPLKTLLVNLIFKLYTKKFKFFCFFQIILCDDEAATHTVE